jgi:nitrite reductase/ring-hydroxylating ferredoxin subunit
MSQWIDICHAEELAPGQRRLVDMGDDDEVLVLNIAGEYYAIGRIFQLGDAS